MNEISLYSFFQFSIKGAYLCIYQKYVSYVCISQSLDMFFEIQCVTIVMPQIFQTERAYKVENRDYSGCIF